MIVLKYEFASLYCIKKLLVPIAKLNEMLSERLSQMGEDSRSFVQFQFYIYDMTDRNNYDFYTNKRVCLYIDCHDDRLR